MTASLRFVLVAVAVGLGVAGCSGGLDDQSSCADFAKASDSEQEAFLDSRKVGDGDFVSAGCEISGDAKLGEVVSNVCQVRGCNGSSAITGEDVEQEITRQVKRQGGRFKSLDCGDVEVETGDSIKCTVVTSEGTRTTLTGEVSGVPGNLRLRLD